MAAENSKQTLTFCYLCEIGSAYHIICLQEDFSKTRFSYRRVLQIETIETMKGILMRVHIQSIDRKIVRSEVEGFKHLPKRQMFAISEYDKILYGQNGQK